MIGDIIEIERARRSLPDVKDAPAPPGPPASDRRDRSARSVVRALTDATRWIGGGKMSADAPAAGHDEKSPAEPER